MVEKVSSFIIKFDSILVYGKQIFLCWLYSSASHVVWETHQDLIDIVILGDNHLAETITKRGKYWWC